MKKASALFLAILMATFSLAGCFGQDDEEEKNDEVKHWTIGTCTMLILQTDCQIATLIHLAGCIMLAQANLSKFA